MIRALISFILVIGLTVPTYAQSLIVVEVRGVDISVGSRISADRQVSLPPGGKLVVVGTDGGVIRLRGPHNGPVRLQAAAGQNASRALSALIATRNDRANRVGAVRSGSDADPIPSPWLIDITRPGERCLVEGAPIGWWRPSDVSEQSFVVSPLDRSWDAAFEFKPGQDTVAITKVSDIELTKAFLIEDRDLEYSIRVHLVPPLLDEPTFLAAWMIEKGCIQQVDALLASLSNETVE